MRVVRRLGVTASLAAILLALLPAAPASACSCAQPSLDELLERSPDAAVARIRRIDPDGGPVGVGRVEEVLHGPDLPEQLPLVLDDGASCRPWVAVGDVAVLALVPDGRSWRTLDCGLMHPTTGIADPAAVDPDARGEVALVALGSFPEHTLLALDDHLRILAATETDDRSWGLSRCGDDVLVEGGNDAGDLIVTLVELPGLESVERQAWPAELHGGPRVADAACRADGTVDLVLRTYDTEPNELRLVRDAFGAAESTVLPPAVAAALRDDDVVLLQSHDDGRTGLELVAWTASGDTRVVTAVDGVRGWELAVSPDGTRALVRGFADEPVLLSVDLVSGELLAREAGHWQPVSRPWLGPERILQLDEATGGMRGPGHAQLRVVDLALVPQSTLPPTSSWNAVADTGVILLAAGGRLTVTDDAGSVLRSTAEPWAAAVLSAVVVGQVAEQDPAEDDPLTIDPLPPVDPVVERAAHAAAGESAPHRPSDPGALTLNTFLLTAAMVALAAVALRSRRRGPREARRSPGGRP